MDRSLTDKVTAYLRSHHVLTLATTGPEGVWAAAVFYVNDGFTFYFLSAPASRHSRNLALNPRVAGTIQEDYSDWPQIKGVQFEGEARRIQGAEQAKTLGLYGLKFAVVGQLHQAPPEIVKAMDKVAWFKVVPSRLYFIDNSLGFGHRDEVSLGTEATPA